MEKQQILSHEIPRASFAHLLKPLNPTEDAIEDLPEHLSLHWASLYLGNFKAFQLVHNPREPDDGLLHTVALFALPEFVKWLLKTDDANYQEEEFDLRIPLAVVCEAKPLPWCKVANEEANFRTRQKEVIQLLVPKTDLNWRFRGKTVLHIALENGLETTKAMVQALKYEDNKENREKYQYTDKEGKKYPPVEYVREFVDASWLDRKALIDCLEKELSAMPKREVTTPQQAPPTKEPFEMIDPLYYHPSALE